MAEVTGGKLQTMTSERQYELTVRYHRDNLAADDRVGVITHAMVERSYVPLSVECEDGGRILKIIFRAAAARPEMGILPIVANAGVIARFSCHRAQELREPAGAAL